MSKDLKSVITCDLDGKIETFSSGAQDMFGYTEDEIIGKGRVSDFSAGQIVLGHRSSDCRPRRRRTAARRRWRRRCRRRRAARPRARRGARP